MNITDGQAGNEPLLQVRKLSVAYPTRNRTWWIRRQAIPVLHDVELDIRAGETFGLAGESGSGKSTLARAILGLQPMTSGSVRLEGAEVSQLRGARRLDYRRRVQIVFQDPGSTLSPRRTIAQTLLEPLEHFGIAAPGERIGLAEQALESVGLGSSALTRYPHQFSSGQRQRIAIARALCPEPDLLIADEAVSALDVSVQAQILELLDRLRSERGLAMLFVSHDLAVIRQLADTVGILQSGHLVECAPADQLFQSPVHGYTRRLLAAAS